MKTLFIEILNMSVMATIIACVVMLVRLPLKKAPRIFSYALWAIVLFRLLCPFKFESALSFLPSSVNTVPQNIIYSQEPVIPATNMPVASTGNIPMLNQGLPSAEPSDADASPMSVLLDAAVYIWFAGMIALLGNAAFSYIRLKRRMKTAVLVRDNIFETDRITSPFVLGFIRPKIYLPVGMEDADYILRHEQTHIRRRDYLVKPVAFLSLCLHWFNPIIWLSYYLMCKDMEMSCDESVLRLSDCDIRSNYSGSLLSASMKRSGLISPLAFGESNTKERVRNVLSYKKPAFWVSVAAVITVLAVTMGFAATRAQEALPWTDVEQKSDWPVRDMTYNNITFGTDRDWIVYRMGREPDSEDVLTNERILYYHDPGAKYTPQEGGETREIPGTSYDVTFYVNGDECINKKQMYGVYRIDITGGSAGAFEMTGREQGDGKLSGVLAQYGKPNAVERDGGNYVLWYYSPDDTDKRMWFEVKDGELTYRMGIACIYEGEGIQASAAVEQLIGSLRFTDNQISFQIPSQYYKPYDWNIHISGRAEFEDGMSMSVHYFEDENERHAWEAGKWYAISTEGRGLTELTMDVYLSDENGSQIERSVDLLAVMQNTAPSNNQDSGFVYTNAGLTIRLPEEYRDKVTLTPIDKLDGKTVIEAYQTASLEKYPDYGGFMFRIVRHTPAEFEDYWPSRDIVGGSRHFARDKAYYYSVEIPTDVQADADEWEEYNALCGQIDGILSSFISDNVISSYDHYATVYAPEYTYPGVHAVFSVTLSNDAKFRVILSKPIRQDGTGIWCVERTYDEYGNLYIAMPETELTAMEYYVWLQAEADAGHRAGLLSVEDVALTYIDTVWDYARHIKDSNIEYIDDVSLPVKSEGPDADPFSFETLEYPGSHALYVFNLTDGARWTIALSQPVRQGASGIWCVERMVDEHGNVYSSMLDTDMGAADYYADQQQKADIGIGRGEGPYEGVFFFHAEATALRYLELNYNNFRSNIASALLLLYPSYTLRGNIVYRVVEKQHKPLLSYFI